ncbi:MAG TPA: gamma-glutamylcyclotransferase family protein [Opitutaceae bacterium]
MTRVFVYGTLKRGGSNHHHLAGQRFVGVGRTEPGFRLYDLGGYPGMVAVAAGEKGKAIEGEIWDVGDDALAGLDELEGLAEGLYERMPVRLQAPFAGERIESYLYLRSVTGRRELGEVW